MNKVNRTRVLKKLLCKKRGKRNLCKKKCLVIVVRRAVVIQCVQKKYLTVNIVL